MYQEIEQLREKCHAFAVIEGAFPVTEEVIKGSDPQAYMPLAKTTLLTIDFSALPEGFTADSAHFHGNCNFWFMTGCINAMHVGTAKKVFVKYGVGELGRQQLEGEYDSMCKLYTALPTATPRPYGTGSILSPGSTETPGYFYLCQFVEFRTMQNPDPAKTASCVAELHLRTQSRLASFGSQVPTFDGIFPHTLLPRTNWTIYFDQLLSQAFSFDRQTNGSAPEFERLMLKLRRWVIPRLLDALSADGREIIPVYIHGDLWEGNIGTEQNTNDIFLFDANGYYAHREMELGMWSVTHHEMYYPQYFEAYAGIIPPDKPAEDFEDRVRLYGLKHYLMYSAHCRNHFTRELAKKDMVYLVRKYGPRAGECECPADSRIAGVWGPPASPTMMQLVELSSKDEQIRRVADPSGVHEAVTID